MMIAKLRNFTSTCQSPEYSTSPQTSRPAVGTGSPPVREGLGGVEKVMFHPQTPQGGFFNSLFFNKSPLRDLGVDSKRGTFSTPPTEGGEVIKKSQPFSVLGFKKSVK